MEIRQPMKIRKPMSSVGGGNVRKPIGSVNEDGKIKKVEHIQLDPEKYQDFTKELYPYSLNFYDFEVFKNDWMVVIINPLELKMHIIVNSPIALKQYYNSHKDQMWSGYNSRQYDVIIMKSILLGMNPKEVNDKLIVDGLKSFQISPEFKTIQFYDYDNIPNGPPIALKTLEGFLGSDIQETSVPFDLPRTLTDSEIKETIKYCVHDVEQTIEVFRNGGKDKYFAHMGLIDMFKLPLDRINKTSAQMVAEILKCKKGDVSKLDAEQWNISLPHGLEVKRYKHIIDWFFKEENHDLNASCQFEVFGIHHTFGWGGAHGCKSEEDIKKDNDPNYIKHYAEKEKSVPTKYEGGNIWHVDVNSYYPSELVYTLVGDTNSTIGETAFGKESAKIYKEIYEKRLALKKSGDKKEQKILKVVLNGTYGILRDINSNAYCPRCATLISAYGQMYLIDLLEHLEDSGCCELVNTNTDGLIIKCKSKEDVEIMNTVCKDWERRSLMSLAKDEIDWIISKDVNNYAFKFSNGKYERKGGYVKELSALDNDLPIVNEAIFEYICHKTDPKEYIENCDDLIKFQKIFRLGTTYKYCWYNGKILENKTHRVFASKDKSMSTLMKCKYDPGTIIETVGSNGKVNKRCYEPEKFPNCSEHVFVVDSEVKNLKCSDFKYLDKDWYIDLVYKRLEDFGINAKPTIFDMF